MAKKKIEHGYAEGIETVNTSFDQSVEFNLGIAELDSDFGRTDLNQLKDKLNEVIRKVNNG